MTDFAIGDIQGCYERLCRVLKMVDFQPGRDRLWVAGDLVNRGPESLATLRYIHSLGESARVVLGNHDLHLLAVAYGGHDLKSKDTLHDILEAPDCERLLDWLRHQHLALYDESRDLFMAHAGLPHIWTVSQALACARELESVLSRPDFGDFLSQMYGNEPDRWDDSLTGLPRLRLITNYFTRMRFIARDGTLNLTLKDSAAKAPHGFRPWFEWPRADQARVIFGHWAALEGKTNSNRYVGLDTGCVWGGALTVMNLETREKVSLPCDGVLSP